MIDKKVIYTAIFGEYDSLLEPNFDGMDNYDFVCFTDNENLKSDKWKIEIEKPIYDDPNIAAKLYKILPHIFLTDYDISIWIDGSIQILCDPWYLFKDKIIDYSYIGFVHEKRNCVYEEAKACLYLGKGRLSKISSQVKKYLDKGYPKNNGLYENGIIFRKMYDQKLIEMEHRWWEEIRNNSKRDQLSFPFVLWKTGYKIGIIDIPIAKQKCFKTNHHSY